MYRRCNVARQRPRCRRPDQQGLVRTVTQREVEKDAGMRQFSVSVGDNLMLADAGIAPRTPRHHVGALVDPATVKTFLQHCPDGIVVLIGKCEVRSTQLRQSESPHKLFNRIRHWTIWSLLQ